MAQSTPRPTDFDRAFGDAKWQDSVTDDQIKKTIVEGGPAVGKSAAMSANPELQDKPEELTALVKTADRSAAHLEATRLAGFSLPEARRFFGPAPKFSAAIEHDYLTPWPADVAEARYLERFAKLVEV